MTTLLPTKEQLSLIYQENQAKKNQELGDSALKHIAGRLTDEAKKGVSKVHFVFADKYSEKPFRYGADSFSALFTESLLIIHEVPTTVLQAIILMLKHKYDVVEVSTLFRDGQFYPFITIENNL